MSKYLDFEKEEKGYKNFYPTRENIKKNIGELICYVDYFCRHRGTYKVRYGKIKSIRYSILTLEAGQEVDIRDIKQAGIKIKQLKERLKYICMYA